MVRIKTRGALWALELVDTDGDTDTETSEESVGSATPSSHRPELPTVNKASNPYTKDFEKLEYITMASTEMTEGTMESAVHPEVPSSVLKNSPTSDEVSKCKRDEKVAAQSGSDETSASNQSQSEQPSTVAMPNSTDQKDAVPRLGDLKVSDGVPESDGTITPGESVNLRTSDTTRTKSKKNKSKKKKPAKAGAAGTISSTAFSSADVRAPKPRFGFDDYDNHLKCRRHECGKFTNCYDGDTVHCPRCGLRSMIRYCSLECLLDPDMRFHWAHSCGRLPLNLNTFSYRIDESTLVARPAAALPFIECEIHDNPARHRQAVFHSTNRAAGDYFIFNDYSLIPKDKIDQPVVIGAGVVIATVTIIPDYQLYVGQSIFQEVLEDCLRVGFQRPDKCLALVDMVTKHLVESLQWSQEVQNNLKFQMKNEFGYDIPQEMLLRFSMFVPTTASA